jgi:hypothetical protein
MGAYLDQDTESDVGGNGTQHPARTINHRLANDQGSLAIWSEWRDSNPRPLVPQTSALTGLRYTPTLALIEKALLRRNASRVAGRSQVVWGEFCKFL